MWHARLTAKVSLICGILSASALSQQDQVDQVDLPSNVDFRRRGWHSVAILGNYLYIEGGEVSAYVNGSDLPDKPSRAFTITASLPLDKPWTTTSLSSELRSITKNGNPIANSVYLWADDLRGKIYSWGGDGPYKNLDGANNRSLWALTPDGRGAGSWAKSMPHNPAVFENLLRTSGGGGTVCGRHAYLLGGAALPDTDPRIKAPALTPISTPGLVTYDLDSGDWANETVPSRFYPTFRQGEALCLPFGGPRGLVLFLGGANIDLQNFNAQPPIPMNQVTIYDPEAKAWYQQTTTGDVPDVRRAFCSAGAKGQNGTYEIFIYGGFKADDDNKATLGDVWVLTVPGFHWTRAGVSGPRRAVNKCVVAGGRQMISVGGKENIFQVGWKMNDPWPQGIGVLDMTALVWRTNFDPGEAAYESPEAVKTWYSNNGLASVQWQSEGLKALFANAGTVGDTTTTPTETLPPSGPQSSHPPIAAIAGGAAAGLVLAVAALLVAMYVVRRRKRKIAEKQPDDHEEKTTITPELSGQQKPAELPHAPPELEGRPHAVIPLVRSELPATTME